MYLTPRNVRLAIAVIVITLFAACIFYLATHGRVSVTNPSGNTLTAVKVLSDGAYSEPVQIKNGAFLSSGSYVIDNGSQSSRRLAHVDIARWLSTTSITYEKAVQAKTTKLASLTYENFFLSDAGIMTSFTDLNGSVIGYTQHPDNDAFGGSYTDTSFEDELISPVITKDGTMLGINQHSTKLGTYSFKTKQFAEMSDVTINAPGRVELEKDSTLEPKLQRSSDINSGAVGLYEKKSGSLRILEQGENTRVINTKIHNDRSVVFDVNDVSWAIIEVSDLETDTTNTKDEDITLGYKATIGYTGKTEAVSVPLGRGQTISSIALSPDGKHLAAIKDGTLWIYNVDSKKPVMVEPLSMTNKLLWNKDSLYTLTSDTGLNVFNTKSQQLISVDMPTQSLSFTDVQPVGTSLYVTAYNEKDNSKLPNGFAIDLGAEASSVTAMLAKNLPYKTSQYSINYLGNTVYIRSEIFPRANDLESQKTQQAVRTAAEKKLRELLGEDVIKQVTIRHI